MSKFIWVKHPHLPLPMQMLESEFKKRRLRGEKLLQVEGVELNVTEQINKEPEDGSEKNKGEESESIKWARSQGIIRYPSKPE